MLGPFLPLCRRARAPRDALARGGSVERIEVEFLGRIAERDTRLLAIAVLVGVAARATPRRRSTSSTRRRWPPSAGIVVAETTRTSARDFTELIRVTVVSGGERDARRRHDARPPQPPAPARGWGRRFNIQLERHVTVFRYERPAGDDRPRRHDRSAPRHQHRLRRRRPRARRGDGEDAAARTRRWSSRRDGAVPRGLVRRSLAGGLRRRVAPVSPGRRHRSRNGQAGSSCGGCGRRALDQGREARRGERIGRGTGGGATPADAPAGRRA